MLNIDIVEELILQNLNQIKKYGIVRIGIFGSFLKGCATKDSDVDILVKFDGSKKNFDNYIDLKFFLEELFNVKVDLVIEENIKKELREEILRSVHYVKAA